MMADSSSQQELLVEPVLTTETTSKELIITTALEGRGQMMESDVVAEVGSSPVDAEGPLPGRVLKEEEATPPTLSTENRTMSHTETEGGRDRGGDAGLDLEDSSSVGTAGGSEDQQESTDSASFSIPSLELSHGVPATGTPGDVEDSSSPGDGGLEDGHALEAAGGAVPAAAAAPPAVTSSSSSSAPPPPPAGSSSSSSAAPPPPAGSSSSSSSAPPPPAVTSSSSSSAAPPPPAGSSSSSAAPPSSVPAYYLVKWITWKEKKTPIITQSENGPCPLLAIMNTLFLRWKAKLPAQTEVVTTEDLMAHLGECVLSVTPREKTDGMELNFQQNMSDAMAVLPKLSTGLDVNVRFTGATDFEYTPECIVFDLLDILLYHGWLVDPQSPEMVSAVGKLSYNQLVEKIIDYKHSADSSRVSEGLVAEQFLESTATQLSYHGLCELNTTAKEGEISVFFRNNHFSTMIKHKGHLYLLVTDQGFLQEEPLVWESLHNVEGDGNFCDSDFRLCHQRAPPTAAPPAAAQEQRRQIDQDYLVAVSLQQQGGALGGALGGAPGPLSDLELARQLQQEEYQQQQQLQQPGAEQTQQVRGQGSQQTRRREKDSDCVLL